jgi:OPA family glycerol-3-phosphate transporter-like MFS transporter
MTSSRVRRWQCVILAVLFVGYTGYYLCRSNLAVAMPLLSAELEATGMSAADAKVWLGRIVSWGTLAYAFAKFLGGIVGDFRGGRWNFLTGMAGAVGFTVLFALGGVPLFMLAWMGNRALQAFGWGGLVKVASRWFPYTAHGTVMALLSLSYLFGDALARLFMARLLAADFTWRQLFLTDAAVLAVVFVASCWLLKESPAAIGEAEFPANPQNFYGAEGDAPRPKGLGALLLPVLRSRLFWYTCVLSLAMTLLRDTFNNWTTTYFKEQLQLTTAEAADRSAIFPFLGGCSVLLAGWFSDRLGRTGRALIILFGMLGSGAALWLLASADASRYSVALVGLVGFLLIGPYSYLTGAIALDFGGKQGSATICGFLDGVGYLAGYLAGETVASLSVRHGWAHAFGLLAGAAWLASIVGFLFWYEERRRARS